jgi:thioredoxin-like negative regulator of GroEL
MSVLDVNGLDQFTNTIMIQDGLVVFATYADWSTPSKEMMENLESISDEFRGSIRFAKMNADTEGSVEMFRDLGISAVPSFVVIKDRVPVNVVSGLVDADRLRTYLTGLL